MNGQDGTVVIVGGGVVGLATARAIALGHPGLRVMVLEKEPHVARHQTGNNSGVIHSGLYYKPGSLKARFAVAGCREMAEYCRGHGIAHDICGKVVVATSAAEIPRLEELHRRGAANGIAGIERLDAAALREREPHAAGVAALFVPTTGIVDYVAVAVAMAGEVAKAGGEVRTGARVTGLARRGGDWIVSLADGEVRARWLVNCGGLQCDRLARMAGARPPVRIVPFRGEYYELKPERHHLVKSLIYPVPDPAFPFLGVHFTRMIGGGVEAGPNAVLSFKREGYTRTSFSLADTLETLAFPGFWRMAAKHWPMAMGEFHRSFSKRAFVRALQVLMPEIRAEDLREGGAGVRAQALRMDGGLVDDFAIDEAEGAVHVLNAPSPAATASLPIGREIAGRAARAFGWP